MFFRELEKNCGKILVRNMSWKDILKQQWPLIIEVKGIRYLQDDSRTTEDTHYTGIGEDRGYATNAYAYYEPLTKEGTWAGGQVLEYDDIDEAMKYEVSGDFNKEKDKADGLFGKISKKLQSFDFETKYLKSNSTITQADVSYGDAGADIELDYYSITINWSMTVDAKSDSMEMGQPEVAKVTVNGLSAERIDKEPRKVLATNLDLETTDVEVEELGGYEFESGAIMPTVDIEIGMKGEKLYIKSAKIDW